MAFVLSPPLMEDTEASRAAKDLFRECVHPTIVVVMVDEASIAGGIRRRAKPKARLFSEIPNEPWLLISHHSTRSDST